MPKGYYINNATGEIMPSPHKKERRVSQLREAEMALLVRVRQVMAARMIVGDRTAALNTQWRLRVYLKQRDCAGVFGIAVRENELVVWMISFFDRRRINTAIEEIAYREENTITCSVWSKKGFESASEKADRLLGVISELNGQPKETEKERRKQEFLNRYKRMLEEGKITQEKYEENVNNIIKQFS